MFAAALARIGLAIATAVISEYVRRHAAAQAPDPDPSADPMPTTEEEHHNVILDALGQVVEKLRS